MVLVRLRPWLLFGVVLIVEVILLGGVGIADASAASASAGPPSPPATATLPDLTGICSGTTGQQAASDRCNSAVLRAVDDQHQREGIGPLVLPTDFNSESTAQQLMQVVGAERTARGEQTPIGLASAYQVSALTASSAAPPAPLPGGAIGGTAVATGVSTPLEADFTWMYAGVGCGVRPGGCQADRALLLDPRVDARAAWFYVGAQGLAESPQGGFVFVAGAGFVPLPVTTGYETPTGTGFLPLPPAQDQPVFTPPPRPQRPVRPPPPPIRIGLATGIGLALAAGAIAFLACILLGIAGREWRRRHPVVRKPPRPVATGIVVPPDDGPMTLGPETPDTWRPDAEIWTKEDEDILSGRVPLYRIYPPSPPDGNRPDTTSH